jgi:hypothetical protein
VRDDDDDDDDVATRVTKPYQDARRAEARPLDALAKRKRSEWTDAATAS